MRYPSIQVASSAKFILIQIMGFWHYIAQQVYERFDAPSIAEVDDARLDYFCKKVRIERFLCCVWLKSGYEFSKRRLIICLDEYCVDWVCCLAQMVSKLFEYLNYTKQGQERNMNLKAK